MLTVDRADCGIYLQPHEDGPLYYPGVCILSLGHPAIIRMTRKSNGEDGRQSLGLIAICPALNTKMR